MLELIIAFVIVLVVIVVFGIIKKLFGLIFKVAFVLLIIILIMSGIIYADLYFNDIGEDTVLVFSNEEGPVSAVNLVKGVPEEFVKIPNYEDGFNNVELGNYTLGILVVGNYTNETIFQGKIGSYLQLMKIFKNDQIFFYPETFTLKIIEGIR